MKSYIVLIRTANGIERHPVAAQNADRAEQIAGNRFQGKVISILLN